SQLNALTTAYWRAERARSRRSYVLATGDCAAGCWDRLELARPTAASQRLPFCRGHLRLALSWYGPPARPSAAKTRKALCAPAGKSSGNGAASHAAAKDRLLGRSCRSD